VTTKVIKAVVDLQLWNPQPGCLKLLDNGFLSLCIEGDEIPLRVTMRKVLRTLPQGSKSLLPAGIGFISGGVLPTYLSYRSIELSSRSGTWYFGVEDLKSMTD
jgi:hypothetical protein